MRDPNDLGMADQLSTDYTVEQKIEALRQLSIIERVLTAPARGAVVIELHRKTFENFILAAQGGRKVVDWGPPDATGFTSPLIRDWDEGGDAPFYETDTESAGMEVTEGVDNDAHTPVTLTVPDGEAPAEPSGQE